MPNNISDIIEAYLKQILEDSDFGMIEIQRSEVAELFHCVPSQINYVISTRFTNDHGYIVESKRGGGGYIRIRKLKLDPDHVVIQILRDREPEISQSVAEALIARLHGDNWLTRREADLLRNMLRRDVLSVELPLRDQLRARLLYTAIQVLAACEE